MSRPATDKRERLVTAAVERFHIQGYAGTSLANVAKAAGLSAGNVFYYFRTKEDLARAVIDAWRRRVAEHLSTLADEADGWRRLERFIEQADVGRGSYVGLGCPLAGLARDLRRESDVLRAEIARVYAVQHEWLRAQFVDVGFTPEDAEAHARFLMASYNGAILLAYAQEDDALITSGVSSLRSWLRELRTSLAKSAIERLRDVDVALAEGYTSAS